LKRALLGERRNDLQASYACADHTSEAPRRPWVALAAENGVPGIGTQGLTWQREEGEGKREESQAAAQVAAHKSPCSQPVHFGRSREHITHARSTRTLNSIRARACLRITRNSSRRERLEPLALDQIARDTPVQDRALLSNHPQTDSNRGITLHEPWRLAHRSHPTVWPCTQYKGSLVQSSRRRWGCGSGRLFEQM
jgi:hypothetical protein